MESPAALIAPPVTVSDEALPLNKKDDDHTDSTPPNTVSGDVLYPDTELEMTVRTTERLAFENEENAAPAVALKRQSDSVTLTGCESKWAKIGPKQLSKARPDTDRLVTGALSSNIALDVVEFGSKFETIEMTGLALSSATIRRFSKTGQVAICVFAAPR